MSGSSEPWGWIVGAGVYIDDVDRQVRSVFAGIILGVSSWQSLCFFVSISFAKRMVGPLNQLVQGLRQSDLSQRIEISTKDEIADAASAFNEYNGGMRETVIQVSGAADRVASGSTELDAPEHLLEIRRHDGPSYQPLVDFEAWRVAMLNFSEDLLPHNLTRMQRHNQTDEVFVLAGRCILFVGDGVKQ